MPIELDVVQSRIARAREDMDAALRDARKAALSAHREGYTVTSIAEALGLSRQTIHNFLNEERK